MKNSTPQQIWEAIKNAKNIILTMDGRYDPDAVISSSLIYNVVKRELNKEIYMTYCDTLHGDVTKFAKREIYHENIDPIDIDFTKYDLHIMVDSGSFGKISKHKEFIKQDKIPVINIDHHEDNDLFGTLNYVKLYGSASALVYEIFKELEIKHTKEECELVLTSILTDTQKFENSITKPSVFRFVADLIDDNGLEYQSVLQPLVMNKPEANFILSKIVFKNLVIDHDYDYAYSWCTIAEANEYGLKWDEVTKRHVDAFKQIETVKFVFFVTELEDENYELSMRSRDLDFSVLDILKVWNGGGYKVAGGAKLGKFESMEEAIEEVKRGIKLAGYK